MLLMVSTQPLMEVSGVRSSWLTDEMKSFFIRSVLASSSAMRLIVRHRRPTSSSYRVSGRRAARSPWAMRVAVASTSPSGRTMERTKNRPLMMVKPSTATATPMEVSSTCCHCRSTSDRLVMSRMAAMPPAA